MMNTLDDLELVAAEVDGAVDQVPDQAAGATAEPPAPAMDWIAMLSPMVAMVGSVITSRAGVPPLTDEEVRNLSAASADVLSHYDLPAMSPLVQSWIALGVVSFAIVGPRVSALTAGDAPGPAARPSSLIDPELGSKADARAAGAPPAA